MHGKCIHGIGGLSIYLYPIAQWTPSQPLLEPPITTTVWPFPWPWSREIPCIIRRPKSPRLGRLSGVPSQIPRNSCRARRNAWRSWSMSFSWSSFNGAVPSFLVCKVLKVMGGWWLELVLGPTLKSAYKICQIWRGPFSPSCRLVRVGPTCRASVFTISTDGCRCWCSSVRIK